MPRKIWMHLWLSTVLLLSACSPLLLKPDVNRGPLSSSVLGTGQAEIEPKLYPPPPTEITAQSTATLSTPSLQKSEATALPSATEEAWTATPLAAHASEEAPSVTPTAPLELPGGAALRQSVAFLLNLSPQALKFIALERLDWPDRCLGLAQPGENCSDELTPGYRGLVQAAGKTYRFHSDLQGKQVRLALLPTLMPTAPALPSLEATAAPLKTATPTATATTLTTQATPTITPGSQPPLSLVEGIARQLKVGSQHLEIHDLQPVVWLNLCFDFRRKDVPVCNQLPTPGYLGRVKVLDASFGGDLQYEFHSNKKGDLLFLMPVAALAARQSLADQPGMTAGEIYFDLVEPWSWPDACAMTPTPIPTNELCLPVQIPGWRVILGANGTLYEFHTDANGQVIQPVQAP